MQRLPAPGAKSAAPESKFSPISSLSVVLQIEVFRYLDVTSICLLFIVSRDWSRRSQNNTLWVQLCRDREFKIDASPPLPAKSTFERSHCVMVSVSARLWNGSTSAVHERYRNMSLKKLKRLATEETLAYLLYQYNALKNALSSYGKEDQERVRKQLKDMQKDITMYQGSEVAITHKSLQIDDETRKVSSFARQGEGRSHRWRYFSIQPRVPASSAVAVPAKKCVIM